MTEFEKALQECLRDLEQGASDVEACLRRYPGYASELEPILQTSAYLERAREVNISTPFRARIRTELIRHMHAHPRKTARPGFLFMRLATGFAAILLALLATGTAYAQSALPGEIFYAWKLQSESAWRVVSPDPIGTDLAIAERRMDELIAVRGDLQLYTQTLRAYLEVADRLKLESSPETEARIYAALHAQTEELNQSGIILPLEQPTFVLPTTPTAIPLPILETPQVGSSHLPQIVPTVPVPLEPTIDIPPVELPPVPDPAEVIPTVELPPLEDLPEIIPSVEIPSVLP